MDTYASGFDSVFNLSVPSTSTAVMLKLFNGDQVQIGPDVPIDVATIVADVLQVTILATDNTVAAEGVRESRLVKLYVTNSSGSTSVIDHIYAIQLDSQIAIMTNSYQTYQEAEMIAIDIPNLDGWLSSSEAQKQAALIESFHRVGKLTFDVDGAGIESINTMSVVDFSALSDHFKTSLKRAQVIEADAALGNDPISEKRQAGLMSETVGESSNMYRPGKPLLISVSRKALNALSGYIKYGAILGRA